MDTPISWIKAYVPDLDCTPQEYADKMTLSGSNMESVIASIYSCAVHDNSGTIDLIHSNDVLIAILLYLFI